MLIGSTKFKEIICWKYNLTCSMCCYRSPSEMHVETLTYSECTSIVLPHLFLPPSVFYVASKVPILIFSGSFNGEMIKWEQQQLNPFLYRYIHTCDIG